MARDPFDALREDLEDSPLDADPLGTEMDPDGERGFLVADVPESKADEAAALAESKGFEDITFEPSDPGREILRFGKRR